METVLKIQMQCSVVKGNELVCCLGASCLSRLTRVFNFNCIEQSTLKKKKKPEEGRFHLNQAKN